MTKEEKAAEMARRKEERKQVCSFLFVNLPSTLLMTPVVYWCSEDRAVERTEEEYLWCKGITILLDIGKVLG